MAVGDFPEAEFPVGVGYGRKVGYSTTESVRAGEPSSAGRGTLT